MKEVCVEEAVWFKWACEPPIALASQYYNIMVVMVFWVWPGFPSMENFIHFWLQQSHLCDMGN